MEPFSVLTARYASLPGDKVSAGDLLDPRYYTRSESYGLRKYLCLTSRMEASSLQSGGSCSLGLMKAQGARILVVGKAFGVETISPHPIWALIDYGFQVVIGQSFDPIFEDYARRNGLLCLPVKIDVLKEIKLSPAGSLMTVDLSQSRIKLPSGRKVDFVLDPFLLQSFQSGSSFFKTYANSSLG